MNYEKHLNNLTELDSEAGEISVCGTVMKPDYWKNGPESLMKLV